ncbi:hypothetical protein DH2020_009557 [Rehmannia glutinosa]|uniref:C3H1-type domain-containing protein n=1 Tax=Rehmannia glutinosa TaxID=99300 RepID=A0ABR0X9D3_REHGL
MDYSESTKVVFQRIEKLDPENVSKIIGYLLLKDHGELEMIRLAFGPDYVIQSLIDKVKKDLNLFPKPKCSSVSNLPTKFTPFTPAASWSTAPLPPEKFQCIPQLVPTAHQLIQNFQYFPVAFLDQPQFLIPLEDQLAGSYLHAPNYFPEVSMQICQNFNQGYCKYGGNCRFLHVLRMENGCFMVLNPPKADVDCVLTHGSLKQLEIELIELLKTRRGIPVSISSLPILYHDKYGRILQVEGYVLEVHGQGKVSCTLTQVLAQMTNGAIRMIDSNFGPVQEVRLPNQEKRMFGFVTFVYPETAALVLTKTNPHFICGAQVLVKPYRVKPMLVDRKMEEKVQHSVHIDPYLPDAESRPPPTPETCENTKLPRKQLIEGREQSVELEKKHILEKGVTSSLNRNNHTLASHTSVASSLPEGVVSNCCTSEDKVYHIKTCNNDHESSEDINLPDSPFGYDVAHGVSPVM